MVPSLSELQSVACPEASALPRTGRRYAPPSLPTTTKVCPLYLPIATECWSECVVWWQSPVCLVGSMLQHGNPKFQYGPGVVQLVPASVLSYTSSRPTYTCFGSLGSTWRNWLYQDWMPGMYPALVSAEP